MTAYESGGIPDLAHENDPQVLRIEVCRLRMKLREADHACDHACDHALRLSADRLMDGIGQLKVQCGYLAERYKRCEIERMRLKKENAHLLQSLTQAIQIARRYQEEYQKESGK